MKISKRVFSLTLTALVVALIATAGNYSSASAKSSYISATMVSSLVADAESATNPKIHNLAGNTSELANAKKAVTAALQALSKLPKTSTEYANLRNRLDNANGNLIQASKIAVSNQQKQLNNNIATNKKAADKKAAEAKIIADKKADDKKVLAYRKSLQDTLGHMYKSPDGKWSTYKYFIDGQLDGKRIIHAISAAQDITQLGDGTKQYGEIKLTYDDTAGILDAVKLPALNFVLDIEDGAQQGVTYTNADFGERGYKTEGFKTIDINEVGKINIGIIPDSMPWAVSRNYYSSLFMEHRDDILDFSVRFDTLNRVTGDLAGYIRFHVGTQAAVEGYFVENYKDNTTKRETAQQAYKTLQNPPAPIVKTAPTPPKGGTVSKSTVKPDVWITCPVCGGSGRITCPVCHGAGTVTEQLSTGPWVKGCLYCGGLGSTQCTKCAGLGRILDFTK
jgi:hypothetical protein